MLLTSTQVYNISGVASKGPGAHGNNFSAGNAASAQQTAAGSISHDACSGVAASGGCQKDRPLKPQRPVAAVGMLGGTADWALKRVARFVLKRQLGRLLRTDLDLDTLDVRST